MGARHATVDALDISEAYKLWKRLLLVSLGVGQGVVSWQSLGHATFVSEAQTCLI